MSSGTFGKDSAGVPAEADVLRQLRDAPTHGRLAEAKRRLLRVGHAKLPSTLSSDECDGSVDRIWRFLDDVANGSVPWERLRDRPAELREAMRKHEFGCNYGAGWVLGPIRETLSASVFGPLWGTYELLSSREGFWLVGDADPSDGMLGDCDTRSTSSATPAVVRSIVVLPDLSSSRSNADAEAGVCATVVLRVDGTGSENGTRHSVPLLPGDVLLYRSDSTCTVSYTVSNNADAVAAPTIRCPEHLQQVPCHAVFDCAMQPCAWSTDLSRPFWNAKLETYKQRQTTGWWIDRDVRHLPPDCVADHQSHVVTVRFRNYYRRNPPILTETLAQLYGLLPYGANDRDLDDSRVRGVRLAQDCPDVRDFDLPSARQPSVPARTIQLTTDNDREMIGQEKYLGGMPSPCGKYVYGVPGAAKRVLRISTHTGKMDWVGPTFHGKFKWLRGVEVPSSVFAGTTKAREYPDGCCIALACNDLSLLKINPANDDTVYSFGMDALEAACAGVDGWYYHGGNLARQNGWIYCIPANATRVAKVNPVSDEVVLIGPDLGHGRCKWFGGIVGSDGCIYGIPHNEDTVLKIDPETDDVSFLGSSEGQPPLSKGRWKWHGGLAAGDKIIGFPNNSDQVLVVNCRMRTVYTVGSSQILRSGRHRIPQDNRYKYLGGALTSDGRFAYLFPCDAERVLRMDTETDELMLVGPPLLDGENKFQNGFCGKDGCLYGIPQRALGVLRIVPASGSDEEDRVDVMPCGEDMLKVKDKFEGGVLGMDGAIYCIPLRAKACIKIVPAANHQPTDGSR